MTRGRDARAGRWEGRALIPGRSQKTDDNIHKRAESGLHSHFYFIFYNSVIEFIRILIPACNSIPTFVLK